MASAVGSGARPLPVGAWIHRHAVWLFAALSAFAVAGFWPPYLRGLTAADAATHAHAATMAAWCALLVAQAALVRAGRRDLHRRAGRAAFILAPAAVLTMSALALVRLAADPDPRARAPLFFVQVAAALQFAIAAGLALALRARPNVHARLMVVTALTLVDPVLARVFVFHAPSVPMGAELGGPIVVDLMLLAAVVADRDPSGRRVWAANLAAFLAVHVATWTLAVSAPWRDAVEALARRL